MGQRKIDIAAVTLLFVIVTNCGLSSQQQPQQQQNKQQQAAQSLQGKLLTFFYKSFKKINRFIMNILYDISKKL